MSLIDLFFLLTEKPIEHHSGSRCLCCLVNDDSDRFKVFGFDQAAVGREAGRAEEAEQCPFAVKMDEP